MIEISIEKANKIRIAYYNNSSNVKSIEMSYRDNFVYMTVSRITGITEYKIIPEPKNDDKSLIEEFTHTLAVFDTSKYSRTTDYIEQESKRLIQAVRDYDKKHKT